METKVFFEDSHSNKLSGTLSNPNQNHRGKIIILCHGLNSTKDGNTNTGLQKEFLKRKIATFRFDFFAHGESEGKMEDRSVAKFVDGILQAINYLKKLGYQNIGICGTSFGGLSAVIAASKTTHLKVIALKAPGMGQTSRRSPNYSRDFKEKTWITAGASVKIPTLIIHGSDDKDVELQFSKELSTSIPSSQLIVIEGADHRFSKEKDEKQSIEEMSNFMTKNL
jgi:uncharacterized protein